MSSPDAVGVWESEGGATANPPPECDFGGCHEFAECVLVNGEERRPMCREDAELWARFVPRLSIVRL